MAALAALPVKLREVVELRELADLSHDAIATRLGITESAAKVRLHRARAKLREHLHRTEAPPENVVALTNRVGVGADLDRETPDESRSVA
jgi:DNA-directed RNA polymerase specialized sigma24 family protein